MTIFETQFLKFFLELLPQVLLGSLLQFKDILHDLDHRLMLIKQQEQDLNNLVCDLQILYFLVVSLNYSLDVISLSLFCHISWHFDVVRVLNNLDSRNQSSLKMPG